MSHLSIRNQSLSVCCTLLALLAGACGVGGDGDESSASSLAPFGSSSPTPDSGQPATAPTGAPDTPANGTANPTPTGNDNPEATPDGIALTPGSTPGGAEMNDGMAAPDMQPDPSAMLPVAGTLERPTKGTSNLFTDLLGVPVAQVDDKVQQAVNRFYGIGTNEPATPTLNTGYRVYYELPQDRSLAFIWAADSNDVRSEGMSYGMMIAVQMNLQDQFDRLWKFAQTYMQFPANAGQTSWRGAFRWQGSVNTANANNWQVNFNANTGPAPDGDEYFAAALYLADRRWGSAGSVNYQREAETISHAIISNPAANGNTPLFNAGNNLVVFFPSGGSANFSDPSYHLPAFYELFALDGPAGDAARWNAIADVSRGFIVTSANANTGLHPDYANFDGTPNAGSPQFRYDAWRVIMNLAVDYAWFSQDPRFTTQANKYHAFFANQLNANKDNVVNAIFDVDGRNASGGGSTALTSTLGAGALASTAPNRKDFVQAAWSVAQQSGQYRYYQEAVYLLGLLNTAGLFGYEWTGSTP